jgi:hypothetical protein
VLQVSQPPGVVVVVDIGSFTSRVDALLTLATIQVLTGESRKPRRRRPRPEAERAAFWEQVGPERDSRDPDDPFPGLTGFLPGGWVRRYLLGTLRRVCAVLLRRAGAGVSSPAAEGAVSSFPVARSTRVGARDATAAAV